MTSLSLIINPDPNANRVLSQFLHMHMGTEPQILETDMQALDWLKQNPNSIEVIFLSGEIVDGNKEFIQALRNLPGTRYSTIVLIVSVDEFDLLQVMSLTNNVVDHVLIKPFRVQNLVQKIERALKVHRQKNPGILLAVSDPDDKVFIKESIAMMGIQNIYEATDGFEAIDLLNLKSSEIGLAVMSWDLSGLKGIQVLKKMSKSQKLSLMPYVMLASQDMLEHLCSVHLVNQEINGYLIRPIDSKNLISQMEQVFAQVEKQNRVGLILKEKEANHGKGMSYNSLASLETAIGVHSDVAQIFESLGDVYKETSSIEKALETYEKGLKLDPDRTTLALKCIDLYSTLERSKDMIRVAKNYLYQFGFDDKLRTRLGKVFLQCGDYGAACIELRRALHVNPFNEEAKSLIQVATDLELGKSRSKAA